MWVNPWNVTVWINKRAYIQPRIVDIITKNIFWVTSRCLTSLGGGCSLILFALSFLDLFFMLRIYHSFGGVFCFFNTWPFSPTYHLMVTSHHWLPASFISSWWFLHAVRWWGHIVHAVYFNLSDLQFTDDVSYNWTYFYRRLMTL